MRRDAHLRRQQKESAVAGRKKNEEKTRVQKETEERMTRWEELQRCKKEQEAEAKDDKKATTEGGTSSGSKDKCFPAIRSGRILSPTKKGRKQRGLMNIARDCGQ